MSVVLHFLLKRDCLLQYTNFALHTCFEWNQTNSHLSQNALYEGMEIFNLVFGMSQFYLALWRVLLEIIYGV